MFTEDEARTKWCPFARVVEGGDCTLNGPFNRYHPGCKVGIDGGVARCIASECMAWRWEKPGFARWVQKTWSSKGWTTMGACRIEGYCGIAGTEGA